MIFPSRKLSRIGGTTLIEVLVVIVVFLVGILAIAQIFPGGIKILNNARNNSMAVALAKSELERLKSRPDVVPGAVVPVRYSLIASVYQPLSDPNWLSTEYSPSATGIDNTGIALGSGHAWQLVSGANIARRVLGETHKITAPKLLSPDGTSVTAPFGSLVVLEFGPIDHNGGAQLPGQLQVYGRDMFRRAAKATTDYNGLRDYEYAVANMGTSAAVIAFPATVAGNYRVSLTATVNNAGSIFTRSVPGQNITIGVDPNGYFLVPVASIANVVMPGETLVNVEVDSMKIARQYTQLAAATPFSGTDLFEYKVLNGRIGELLFNPNLFGKYEERAGTTRQPYVARIDYDVRDWRILHEDFRVSLSSPAGLPKVLKLAVPSLKTNSVNGADGLIAPSHDDVIAGSDSPNAGMEDVYVVNNAAIAGANTAVADNMLVVDLATGGQLLESYNGRPTMTIDKSSGYITLYDIDNDDTNGLTQAIATVDGSVALTNVTGRVLRTYYMGREEWAVQVTRNAAQYASTYVMPDYDKYYVGGTGVLNGSATRIYFPRMDANRKIVIGKVRYIWNDAGTPREGVLEGAEFQIRFRSGADSITQPLPSIDLTDILPLATSFSQDTPNVASRAYSVSDVRGVSMVAKVFYNSGAFSLGANTANNLNTNFSNWAKDWRVVSKETYLHRGDAIQ